MAETERAQGEQDCAEENSAVDLVKVGREELGRVVHDEVLAEKPEYVTVQLEAVRIEHRPDQRASERGREVLGLRQPPPWIAAQQPLCNGARQIGPDQEPADDEAAVQIGPQGKEGGEYPHRRRARALEQPQQYHDRHQGKKVGARHPVPRAQHRRENGGEIRQERVHVPPQQQVREPGIGDRDQETREDRNARKSAQPVSQRVHQLAAILEAEKGCTRAGEGERIAMDQSSVLQHVEPMPDVSGRVAIGVQKGLLQADRHQDRQQDEHHRRNRGWGEADASREIDRGHGHLVYPGAKQCR